MFVGLYLGCSLVEKQHRCLMEKKVLNKAGKAIKVNVWWIFADSLYFGQNLNIFLGK